MKLSIHKWSGRSNVQRATWNARGFTLIEVVLAIGIAIGILVVALYFYSQAVELRARLLQESDRVASIRLFLEQLTADLRAAYAQPQVGFAGDATTLRLAVAGVPRRLTAAGSRSTAPECDLKIVSYGTARVVEGTNQVVAGLTRIEESFIEPPRAVAQTNRVARGPVTFTSSGPDVAANAESATSSGAGANPNAPPLIDTVHFLQFYYWDGSGWSERWDATTLPACVEVDLGVEPLPEGTDPLDYPYELFRRVIYLPGSRGAEAPADPFDLFDEGLKIE
jgi:type II secretory pathway pseudopilin PulG